VPAALAQGTDATRLVLKLFYTAAMLLQQRYRRALEQLMGAQPLLPNQFGSELGISIASDPWESLQRLGKRHAALTGLSINWVGAYEHAARRLIKRLECEARWITPQVA
jgi:hypothetical protein